MMAAAAGATSALLGDQVEIGPPETRFFESPDQADEAYELTPHVVSVPFTVLDEPCRLVLLVPNAFIVKMTRALSDLEAEAAAGGMPHRRRRRPATRCGGCRCASGPSSAAATCRSAARCRCSPARSSTSTRRRTTRCSCTSTGGGSAAAGCS